MIMKLLPSTRRLGIFLLSLAVLATPVAQATNLKKQNLTQLISQSQAILAGGVTKVTDGFDENGIPYTEVTITVSSSAKGGLKDGDEYTFRQFGLLKPRTMANGKRYLAVTPEGFARWSEGQTVVAFMNPPASKTGLQSTVGLTQGKMVFGNGKLANEFNNASLFDGVEIEASHLSPEEQNMITTPGAVDAQVFMSLVDRAVSEDWIGTGVMN